MLSLAVVIVVAPANLNAQDADPVPSSLPSKPDSTKKFPNIGAGELTPSTGFTVVTTDFGTLNVSVYGVFRYVDQLPGQQTFTDHLGRVRDVDPQNSLNWHRTMMWLSGWFWDPKFRYTITAWGLATTQQTLMFGNLQYFATNHFNFGIGIAPSLTARSLQGSWPFWAGSDRLMGEEFFRGGFSSGVWMSGEVLPRLDYNLSINNNISELGVVQANDTRNMFFSGTLRWQPTTGEFGPRGGFNDFEEHKHAATQFGLSSGQGVEGRYAPLDQAPNNTQIKISDGLNVFEAGALAEGVTVTSLTYRDLAMDAGVKYRGFALQGEYYWRTLDDFLATGPLPLRSIYDHGFMAEMSYMAIPHTLDVHVVGTSITDQFRRYPWELGGGANFYPSKTRSLRVNLHVLHVNKSPASSFFGYYLAGLTGTVFSLGADILL
jgi:hypothetical protein